MTEPLTVETRTVEPLPAKPLPVEPLPAEPRTAEPDQPLELFQAYRRGLLRKRVMQPRDLNFSNLISQSILAWPHTRERKFLNGTARHSYTGLLAARRGEGDAARSAFSEARRQLDQLDDGLELIGIALFEAAVAYLDHREGRHQEARDRVSRALDADLALERDYDLSIMLMHRIQQGHNLARVDLKLGNREEALRLSGLLIAFLEDRVDDLPFHKSWSPKIRRKLSGYLVRGMISQIAGEAASHIATGPDEEAEWSIFLEAACPEPPARTTRFPQAQHGLYARAALRANDRQAWYEHLLTFFDQGPAHCPDLFYAGVVSFAEDCRRGESPWGPQVAEVIEKDSAKWRGCNPFLRQRLLRSA